MCAIIGALFRPGSDMVRAHALLRDVWEKSHERGRDGRGWTAYTCRGRDEHKDLSRYDPSDLRQELEERPFRDRALTFIANLRAEPTTEYVQDKSREDQQPYGLGGWSIVHNGTIANDTQLRTNEYPSVIDSAALVEQLCGQDDDTDKIFEKVIRSLKGSYAILAMNEKNSDNLFYACNYRPLWWIDVPNVGIIVASARQYLPSVYAPRMLPPYSYGAFTRKANGSLRVVNQGTLLPPVQSPAKALVVCSGGLDSVVAATYAKKNLGYDVTLLHFTYGSRASEPEIEAIIAVAQELGVQIIQQGIGVYRKEDSPLLQSDSKIAGGEAGAEFAYEWVPARNLLMLSMATAIAEARGFETIILGNNLEEAGAYPDNEPEFITRFNDLLPFAVGDGKRMKVIMPVGNMMKHEIVALGLEIDAPLHLTWSCYRALENENRVSNLTMQHQRYIHCGKCGPCFMRRTAFVINNAPEVIEYAE